MGQGKRAHAEEAHAVRDVAGQGFEDFDNALDDEDEEALFYEGALPADDPPQDGAEEYQEEREADGNGVKPVEAAAENDPDYDAYNPPEEKRARNAGL